MDSEWTTGAWVVEAAAHCGGRRQKAAALRRWERMALLVPPSQRSMHACTHTHVSERGLTNSSPAFTRALPHYCHRNLIAASVGSRRHHNNVSRTHQAATYIFGFGTLFYVTYALGDNRARADWLAAGNDLCVSGRALLPTTVTKHPTLRVCCFLVHFCRLLVPLAYE